MNPIDTYLSHLSPEYRKILEELRTFLRAILPKETEECISYGMPAFKVHGKAVAGFSAFKNHLTFFPFSGSVVGIFHTELKDFKYTKSGVHFTPEKPIPRELIEKMVKKRLESI